MKLINYAKFVVCLCVLGTLLINTSGSASTSPACGGWFVVSSPSPGSNDYLNGVAAISANDVWAVGYFDNSNGLPQTLIEQWKGKKWSVVSSPNPGTFTNYLFGVAVVSANNIWAVGTYQKNVKNNAQTLIEHWNGMEWSIVPSPSPGSDGMLNGVAAISANDVWTVGTYFIYNQGQVDWQTLIEHWDGKQWNVVPSPSPGSTGNFLQGVAVASTTDVWAVGDYDNGTLIEHWNGTQWNVLPSPSPGSQDSLFNVAVVLANSIWAVGDYVPRGSSYDATLIEHWDGTQWSVVPSPSPGSAINVAYAVAPAKAKNVWTVGYSGNLRHTPKTLTEKWNGQEWKVMPSPNPGTFVDELLGVAAVPAKDIFWAVGDYTNNNSLPKTLTEIHC